MTPRSLSTGRLVRARVARTVAVAGLLVVAGLGAATTASAHSQLERTDPADGSQVAALPEQITLTFNQNVLGLGSAVEVTGPGGSVSEGAPTVVNNQMQQAIRPGSAAGAYTVLWRVTSADGHPVSGRFAFTAAAGSAGAGAADGVSGAAGTSAAGGGSAMLVWLLLGCLGVAVVGGVFLASRRPALRPTADETPATAEESPADDVKVAENHS